MRLIHMYLDYQCLGTASLLIFNEDFFLFLMMTTGRINSLRFINVLMGIFGVEAFENMDHGFSNS